MFVIVLFVSMCRTHRCGTRRRTTTAPRAWWLVFFDKLTITVLEERIVRLQNLVLIFIVELRFDPVYGRR